MNHLQQINAARDRLLEMQQTVDVPIIEEGSDEDIARRWSLDPDVSPDKRIHTYVLVGKQKHQHEHGGGGMGVQTTGRWVQGICRGRPVYSRMMVAPAHWDATVRNTLGRLGAYVTDPVPETRVDEAVKAALAAVRRAGGLS